MASPTLVGTRVTLRAVRASDAAARRRWGWHRDIERSYGYERDSGPMSEQEAQDWLGGVRAREGSTFRVVETGADLAGVAFLHAVNTQDRRARFEFRAAREHRRHQH